MRQKPFTPVTFLQSEIKQWKQGLKFWKDELAVAKQNSYPSNQHKKIIGNIEEDIEEAKRKIKEYKDAVEILKKYSK